MVKGKIKNQQPREGNRKRADPRATGCSTHASHQSTLPPSGGPPSGPRIILHHVCSAALHRLLAVTRLIPHLMDGHELRTVTK